MSILFCNFALEIKGKGFFDRLRHRHHLRQMANTYRNINPIKVAPDTYQG